MRSLIVTAIFLASHTSAAASDYEETRDLAVSASDVSEDLIIVDDGSGSVSFSDVRGTVEEDG